MYKFKRILRKIILLFLCFLCIISILNVQTSALAVEIIGGSYVAYAILAAALAAAGYTIATSQIDSSTFQSILDSSGAEDIKALITATTVFTSVNGRVFFNWSAQQWGTFLNWINHYVATGNVYIPNLSSISNLSDFVGTSFSSYISGAILTNNNSFGYQIGGTSIVSNLISGTRYYALKLNLESNTYFAMNNNYIGTSIPKVVYGSNFLLNSQSNIYCVCLGVGLHNGSYAQTISDVNGVQQLSGPFNIDPTMLYINEHRTILEFVNGVIQAKYYYQSNRYNTYTIAPTLNFTTSYDSLLSYMTDVINTGALVGDWSGIGDDVINPADDEVQVGIDSYPNWRVGTGIDSLPDSIDGSIDIPLNRYIESDLGPDVVDPYVDFTPWDSTTVPPDDVIPDTRLNPPVDVTANPDTPWADDESYPLDYPTDTTTDNLPPGNNPNPDPGQDENTNRLKLGPILLSKFPFCLPWDLQHGLKVLVAPAEAPQFSIPFVNERLGINTSINIDLSFADTLAKVTRWFLSALWVVILILITSKIIWK